jgi:hypothetical protein
LIEDVFSAIDREDLENIGEKIAEATAAMVEFDEVKSLETSISELFRAMSGPKQDVQPTLGFSATDSSRINRQIRLLIDDGRRGVADASLSSANLIFLTLKLLDLERLIERTGATTAFSQSKSQRRTFIRTCSGSFTSICSRQWSTAIKTTMRLRPSPCR